MSKRTITRREFLSASVLVAAGAMATACAAPAPTATPAPTQAPAKATMAPTAAPKATTAPAQPTAVPKATTAPAAKFKEAPMLAKLVQEGKLPPVEKRLPQNPCVMPVMEKIGKHGGMIRRSFKGVSDRWGPTKLIDRSLAWYDKNLVMQPRLVESWETNADASQWTWHLRKGLKYSDGTEVTSANFAWFYKYVANNRDINKAPWGKYTTRGPDGKPVMAQLTTPDDYTVVVKFAHPKPLHIYETGRDHAGFLAPGHYMKQFHIELTSDKAALEAEVKKAGFNAWNEYYTDRDNWYMNPDKPQLGGWVSKNKLSEQLFIMERNPYFWAVDPEGNQLPYLDKVTHRLFEQTEVFNLWITNGEIDFQARHVGMANFTLFKQNEQKGDYKVFIGKTAGHFALQPNHTVKNPKLREFFQDRRVRIAMSLAVDRKAINELVYDGLYTPRQYSPLKMSAQYYEKLSNAYINYDPAKANQLLDEAGYKKGPDGFRTFKDGTPISFTIEGTTEAGTPGDDAHQEVIKYFAKVGIKCAYKYFERALYTQHYEANEIEAAFWGGDRTVVPLAPGAPIFLGTMLDRPWCPAWGRWRLDPTHPAAEKPPEGHWIWNIWKIWDQLAVTADPKKQNELFFQILDIWAEELPMIGFLGEMPSPIIVKNGFKNYLQGMPMDDTTGDEHLLNTETYFWEEPEKHSG